MVRRLENLTIIISSVHAYNYFQYNLHPANAWQKFDVCALRNTNNCSLTLIFKVRNEEVKQKAQLVMQSVMPLLNAAGRLVVSVVGPHNSESIFDTIRRSISSRPR